MYEKLEMNGNAVSCHTVLLFEEMIALVISIESISHLTITVRYQSFIHNQNSLLELLSCQYRMMDGIELLLKFTKLIIFLGSELKDENLLEHTGWGI